MSLGLATFITRGSLAAASGRMALVSRNIAASDIDESSRKILDTLTTDIGGARLQTIRRAGEAALREAAFAARGQAAAQKTYAESLDTLDPSSQSTDDPDGLSARLAAFAADLSAYAASANDTSLAAKAAAAATELAASLNRKASAIAALQREASQSAAASVGRINESLSQIEDLNRTIVSGAQRGSDVSDALDARDRLVAALSEEIGVRVVSRECHDIALYTDGGAVLFERQARPVELAGVPGAEQVLVDGVAVTGTAGAMASQEGRVAGLLRLRDETAPAYLKQLDEVAGGLIRALAEESSVAGAPARPGLFTWPGAPAVPATGAGGLAGAIGVSALLDSADGLARLRDGGLSEPDDPSYRGNAAGAGGYTDRLLAMRDALAAAQTFAAAPGFDQTQTLAARASDAAGWLARLRQSAAENAAQAEVGASAAAEALGRSAGINLDDELARMLDVENAYAASSRLLTTIDAMFNSLLEATR